MARLNEILGYEVLATLGYGARSTIFAVRGRDRQVYALKRVSKQSAEDQRYLEQAELEHRIASQFDHPILRASYKLMKQRAMFRTTQILVLMELVDGQTLEQHKPEHMLDLCDIVRQVGTGLDAMHEAGYVHADIKPNNILVTEQGQAKVIDFGQSCPIGTVKPRIQGTPDYIAPEQVMRRKITPQTDVFNLGATLYWLLTSRHVPTMIPKGQPGVTLRTDEPCRPPKEVDPTIPPALSALVMNCIEVNPKQRPESMAIVLDRLDLAIAQIRRQDETDTPKQKAV